ncbi:acetate kinase [Paenarthrobacter nicotinovorans]|uniref:acetate/propionate family kinase n=1 Tax=Paenarthrobacter nicotinovorans TaxID=29320 RepID=UPI00277D9BAF|nr:acetate/propionate family kinase [Paenarthrobacter nicotinovorans]MDP9933892.1 acetate kinase [Paenarthrobacter nicotinovorans]
MRILVLNPGSSSLKYQVRETNSANETQEVIASGHVGWTDQHQDRLNTLSEVLDEVDESTGKPDGVGHRVVHGGVHFDGPVRVTAGVVETIKTLGTLAPLHNPASAESIDVCVQHWPGIPQVAVFDTGFHSTIPDFAARYAIPQDAYSDQPVRRYGFHGISVAMACQDAATFLGLPTERLNAVVAHLGNGASVTAVEQGRSVDTSMGMTPLEGLVMGTRSGDLDPSIAVLLQRAGATVDEVDELLNHRSGLMALAGTPDMRRIEKGVEDGDPTAVLALKVASYRLAKYIAAYSMVVGGADTLVFTGGIGENSALYRQATVSWLGPLGIALHEGKNQTVAGGIRDIGTKSSHARVLVVPSDEERAIANSTVALLTGNETKRGQ